MNKPIRTISIFCLLLFLALMVNATYLQYWQAGDLNDDPRNRREIVASYSRERGAILTGRTTIAESVESDDEYQYQRTYPKPFVYAPVTGWFSYYSQTGIERRRTTCSPARTRACSSPSWSTCSATTPRRAATCS